MALSAERRLRSETWAYKSFLMPTANTAWKGGIAVYDQSAGKVIPAGAQTDLTPIGTFEETVANTSGADKAVTVRLFREVRVTWFKNDGTNPVLATDIGKSVYMVDDETVSILSTSRSVLGQAWAIDTTLGVAVEVK